LLSRLRRRRIYRHDDIHIESNKLGGERAETIELTLCVSMFDPDASSFYPSQIPQTLPECIYLSCDRGVSFAC
jgi:hypothetical protein